MRKLKWWDYVAIWKIFVVCVTATRRNAGNAFLYEYSWAKKQSVKWKSNGNSVPTFLRVCVNRHEEKRGMYLVSIQTSLSRIDTACVCEEGEEWRQLCATVNETRECNKKGRQQFAAWNGTKYCVQSETCNWVQKKSRKQKTATVCRSGFCNRVLRNLKADNRVSG